MPTVCIHCAMRAIVAGTPSPVFDEEPDDHARIHHPDLVATQRERVALLEQLARVIPKETDQ